MPVIYSAFNKARKRHIKAVNQIKDQIQKAEARKLKNLKTVIDFLVKVLIPALGLLSILSIFLQF